MARWLGDLVAVIGADIDGFEKAMQSVRKDIKETADNLKTGGEALSLAVSLPLAALGAAALKSALDFDEASDTIVARTDATGDALAGLQNSLQKVYAETLASAKDTGNALAELAQRTGLTGPVLEQLTKNFLMLARQTNSEAIPTIQAFTRAISQWQIPAESSSAALEYLARVSRATGIGVQQLSEEMTAFAPLFRQLNVSFTEGAALLGQFEKQGVSADTMMAGLRSALAKISATGADASTALKGFIHDIQTTGSQSDAVQKAVEIFGRKAGPQLADAIRTGRLEVAAFTDKLAHTSTTIQDVEDQTKDFPETMKEIGRSIQVALLPLGNLLMKTFGDLLEAVKPFITDGLLRMAAAFSALSPIMQKIVVGAGLFLASLGPLLIVMGGIVSKIPAIITGFKLLQTEAGVTALRVGLITAALAALGLWVYNNWPEISGMLSAGLKELGKQISQVSLDIENLPFALAKAAGDFVKLMIAMGQATRGEYASAINTVASLTNRTKAVIQAAGEGITAAEKKQSDERKKIADDSAASYKKSLQDQTDALMAAMAKGSAAFEGEGHAITLNAESLKARAAAIDALNDANDKLVDKTDELIEAQTELDEKFRIFWTGQSARIRNVADETGTAIVDMKAVIQTAGMQAMKAWDDYVANIQSTGVTATRTIAQSVEMMYKSWSDAAKSGLGNSVEWYESTASLIESLEKLLRERGAGMTEANRAMWERMLKDAKAAMAAIVQTTGGATAELKDAFRTLGIPWRESLEAAVDSNRAAMERITADETSSITERLEAQQRYLQSYLNLLAQRGEATTAEFARTRAQLEQVSAALDVQLGRQSKAWEDFRRNVGNSFDTFGGDLNDALWSGDKSFGQLSLAFLKDLGKSFTGLFIDVAMEGVKKFLVGALSPLITGFGQLVGHALNLGSTITGAFKSGTDAAGGLTKGLGSLGSAFGGLGSLFSAGISGAISGAVSGLITSLTQYNPKNDIRGFRDDMWAALMVPGPLTQQVVNLSSRLQQWFTDQNAILWKLVNVAVSAVQELQKIEWIVPQNMVAWGFSPLLAALNANTAEITSTTGLWFTALASWLSGIGAWLPVLTRSVQDFQTAVLAMPTSQTTIINALTLSYNGSQDQFNALVADLQKKGFVIQ